MRTILVILFCFCSTLLKAQLDLPMTWYVTKRITTHFRTDTAYTGSRAEPDTLIFSQPMSIQLNSSSLKIGLENFVVESITWPTNKDRPSTTDPELIVATCKGGILVLFFGRYVSIRYKERDGWRREISFDP